MSRIRTLKPGNWKDERVIAVSRDARLLRDVLITFADDDGRWRHQERSIIGHGYPEDDDVSVQKIRKWAAELAKSGLIALYGDGKYGCFPTWHSHQVINKYRPSDLPTPDVYCVPRSTKGGTTPRPSPDGSRTAPVVLPEASHPEVEKEVEGDTEVEKDVSLSRRTRARSKAMGLGWSMDVRADEQVRAGSETDTQDSEKGKAA